MSHSIEEIRAMAARIGVTDLDEAGLERLRLQTESIEQTIARAPRWRAKEIEPAAIFVLPVTR